MNFNIDTHQNRRVAEAAAIGRHDPEHGDTMHAFVTVSRDSDPDLVVRDIFQAMDAHLADSRRPERLEVLADMPHGPTGKIDRKELRRRATARRPPDDHRPASTHAR